MRVAERDFPMALEGVLVRVFLWMLGFGRKEGGEEEAENRDGGGG